MALTDIMVPGQSDQLEEIPAGTLGTPNDIVAEAVAVEELVLAVRGEATYLLGVV